jgi:DNA-3-methyladenine glycosylase II
LEKAYRASGPRLHDPKAAHEPYEALVRAIAYQQLTAKAGDATIKTISEGAQSGLVPTREVAVKMDDRALIERIISVKGIGRWTVEMLLMYSLERVDVLPVDDFGIRKGCRILKSLTDAPKPRDLLELGKGARTAPDRRVLVTVARSTRTRQIPQDLGSIDIRRIPLAASDPVEAACFRKAGG